MENAQLISLSRQIGLQRQMDIVANNLANMNTTGFKSEDLLFKEYQMPVARDRDFSFSDQKLSYTEDWGTVRDMSAGAIEQTGNPLDVAAEGPGFFAVQTQQGERYTKGGSFQLDPTGTLVDLDGNPVLTESGPVKFDVADSDINIAADGTISTSDGPRGRLKMVEFADPQTLEHQGDNLFSGTGGTPAAKTHVLQGSIEKSNVSGVTEMSQMVRVTRAYETLANLMEQQNDLRRSAIQRLGDITA
ncbi:MAG TPA: flagellar basal-body rod protein FlgF [Devosiaceae bacterium]|jgi:flagellar basal-body rod protein FlgF